MNFDENIAKQLLQSPDEFPVDFDEAWKWVGYKRKDYAKDALINGRFRKGVDYIIEFSGDHRKTPDGGRPREVIRLTLDCFKAFCLKAETQKGDEVRLYFIHCEKELRKRIEEDKRVHRERVINAVVDEQHTPWRKRFEDEFFDEAYRITGQDRPEKGHPGWMGTFINQNVYDLFPEGVPDRLREVNPSIHGRRKRKHHQHLTRNLGCNLLDYQKGVTIAVMRLSPAGSPQRFRQNMQRACGTSIQVELPFMDEMDSKAS